MTAPAQARTLGSATDSAALAELLDDAGLAWSILDVLPGAAVVLFNRDLCIVGAAGEALLARGYKRELLVGRLLRDVLPAESYDRYLPHYMRALLGEASSLVGPGADDETIYASDFSPLRAADGSVLGGIAVSRDVTEARRTQAGLAESGRQFRQWEEAFAGSTRAIAVTDAASGRVLSVNPAFAAMHGGRVEDFTGRSIESLVSGNWQSKLAALLERVDREGHVYAETEHVRLDGTVFPSATEMITTRSSDGELLYRVAWFEDLTERRAQDLEYRRTKEMFEAAFAHAPNGVALIGLDRRFLRVNAALCEILGRTQEELVGSQTTDYCHPDDLPATHSAYADLGQAREPVSIEKRFLRPDGNLVWTLCRGVAVRDGDGHGEARYIVTHFQDITSQKLADEAQSAAFQHFEAAFIDAPIGMALVAPDGHWTRVNRTLCELVGYSAEELLKLTFQEITHPDDLDADLAYVQQLLAGEIKRYAMEKRYFTAQGHQIWVNLTVSLVRDADQHPLHFISQIEDISERKRLETSLQHLADHDPLTELWNRRRFDAELQRQVGRSQRYGERAALCVIDLNGFKSVNDRHGHRAGDELLREIAAALRGRLRGTDSIARLGGDEFAALLANVSPDQAARLAVSLREAVEASRIRVAAEAVSVSASIGLAAIGADTASAHEAYEQADQAMYRHKGAERQPARPANATRSTLRGE